MATIINIFLKVEQLIKDETDKQAAKPDDKSLKELTKNLISTIYSLIEVLKNDDTILISVKNQKTLRTCYEIICSLGLSQCLIPGVGIGIDKRCSKMETIPEIKMNDDQKYDLLKECTDFFTKSYTIPVLKNIILTFHLSDYLAGLIQLSFAPFKKPGTYVDYIMTEEKYKSLLEDQQEYTAVYENLVQNCFQPFLMKELFVLQSVKDPPAPRFVKKVISDEMSRRLLTSGGLLSLIRCFIETFGVDTGYDWEKIETICKIICLKHGKGTETEYLANISIQIQQILSLNNSHYLTTSAACVYSLNEKFPASEYVKNLTNIIFQQFDYTHMTSKALSGTILMTTQKIEHTINLLYANLSLPKLEWPSTFWLPNMFIIFLLGTTCQSHNLKDKINLIVIKCLEFCDGNDIKTLLFGSKIYTNIVVEESETGLVIKYIENSNYPKSEALELFGEILKSCNQNVMKKVFDTCLQIVIEITEIRSQNNEAKQEDQKTKDDSAIFNIENYAIVLQLLTKISTYPKLLSSLKENLNKVLEFIEHFLVKKTKTDNDSETIALILLNTVLAHVKALGNNQARLQHLLPVLHEIQTKGTTYNIILSKEALSIIGNETSTNTPCSKALNDVFNHLLPVRGHGIIELTKLIEAKDPEAIAKKHYIFCILQDQLKHPDSYIYLAAINCIVALCVYCTEDVLQVLCKEFLNMSDDPSQSKEEQNKSAELRLKVGDVIVKVTRRLGEKAVTHKSMLLNTMLLACRDDDPLIRTSALSNLAEIALVINYKMGPIIYEVLLSIWGILESDKAIECKRAAVMVITSLFRGLGKASLLELKDNLIPIYRSLKSLYKNPEVDAVLKLHAQLALEELNDIVMEFLLSGENTNTMETP